MTISADDVRHIAALARLALSDAEVERFQRELSTILDYVAQLDALDAGRTEEPAAPDTALRADVIAPWGDIEALLREAPDVADGFFRVPRVIE